MFVETILSDALHPEEAKRTSVSAFTGRWKNSRGSIMELTVHEDHHIHGSFHTEIAANGASFHLTGFAEGDAVSFAVDFGPRGSVASWSGHFMTDERGEHLVTLWHLARPVKDPHSLAALSGAILTGADEFSRIEEADSQP